MSQPFIANAKVRANGPVEGTEGQDGFPKTGQRQSFAVAGGDWQELNVSLPVEGQLVHLRLFLSDSKLPTEIDWIEVGSKDVTKDRKRWNFDAQGKPEKRN